MSRPEFDRAWELMEACVRNALQDPGTDRSAVLVTMLRFSAYLHQVSGESKSEFMKAASLSYDQMAADIEREKLERGGRVN